MQKVTLLVPYHFQFKKNCMDPFCVYANLYEKDIKYNIVMYVKNCIYGYCIYGTFLICKC